jgi:hypothetical protein
LHVQESIFTKWEKKNEIVKHFVELGFAQRSVYRWLSKIENGEKLERKKGHGRPVKIATKSYIQKISRCFDYKSGCSQNRVSRRFNCSKRYISTI